jgi:hypothetical protein
MKKFVSYLVAVLFGLSMLLAPAVRAEESRDAEKKPAKAKAVHPPRHQSRSHHQSHSQSHKKKGSGKMH